VTRSLKHRDVHLSCDVHIVKVKFAGVREVIGNRTGGNMSQLLQRRYFCGLHV